MSLCNKIGKLPFTIYLSDREILQPAVRVNEVSEEQVAVNGNKFPDDPMSRIAFVHGLVHMAPIRLNCGTDTVGR